MDPRPAEGINQAPAMQYCGAKISIVWQNGPIKENGVNGANVEDVLKAALERLQVLNQPPYNCRDNSIAITHIEDAILRLEKRTREREARGVEGTSAP